MDGRISSVDRVVHAMAELDHSELTRGNVKAATRAIDAMHGDLKKERGFDQLTDTFSQLLSMAEKGNWTDLRKAKTDGSVEKARDEVKTLFSALNIQGNGTTPSTGYQTKTPADRGYPPQHTVESEYAYERRKKEASLEHRNRRSVESTYSESVGNGSDHSSHARRRDDPKQVSEQMSQIAREKLRNGGDNAALQDLSEPTRIVEMFAELHKREWMAAYEEVNQQMRDSGDTIKHLEDVLRHAYDYCKETAERQLVNLQMNAENEILFPNITAQSRKSLEAQQRPDKHLLAIIRDGDDMIKDFRKFAASASLPVIKWLFYEEVLKSLQPAQRSGSDLVSYIDRCVELTWMMNVQQRPMQLEFCKSGDKYYKTLFKPFTKMGNVVQQCVWPALFLHLDGPLLEKGIAHLG